VKQIHFTYLAVPVFLLVAACNQPKPDANETDPCSADIYAPLLNTNIDNVNATSLPYGTRIHNPSTMHTADYLSERLNIENDSSGTITRIWCG